MLRGKKAKPNLKTTKKNPSNKTNPKYNKQAGNKDIRLTLNQNKTNLLKNLQTAMRSQEELNS